MKKSTNNIKSTDLLKNNLQVDASGSQVYTRTHIKGWLIKILKIIPAYFWLILFLFIALVPFVISLYTSVKTSTDLLKGVFRWPEVWNWSNYTKVWTAYDFNVYFLNSISPCSEPA